MSPPTPVRIRPPPAASRRYFVASTSAADDAVVPVMEATDSLLVPLPGHGVRRAWRRMEALALAVTDQDECFLIGEVDWEGDLRHADLWGGFTDEELIAFHEQWQDLMVTAAWEKERRERAARTG